MNRHVRAERRSSQGSPSNQRINPTRNHGASLSVTSVSHRPWFVTGYPHVSHRIAMLKPRENIHKFLLSIPAKFVGEYSSSDLLINHAWPDLMSPSAPKSLLSESPIYRTYFVVVVKIENPEKKSVIVPNYHPFGDFIATCPICGRNYLDLLCHQRFCTFLCL